MTILRFGTFYAYGYDRGAHHPLYKYEVELPEDVDADKWLTFVAAAYGEAAAIAGNWNTEWSQEQVYVDKRTDLVKAVRKDSDWRMVLSSLKFESPAPRSLSTDPKVASRQLFADSAVLEDSTFDEVVDWDSIWAGLEATPTTIKPGTLVYRKSTSTRMNDLQYTYAGLREEHKQDPTHVTGAEVDFVPVEFVHNQSYDTEAFPMPLSIKKSTNNGWWARSKQNPKVEALGRTKKEAIFGVTLQLAHTDYWKLV